MTPSGRASSSSWPCGRHRVDAEDGDQALLEWAQHRGAIDVVVTDLVMPGLTGRELAARLRAERPSLKLVFISGFEDTDDDSLPGPMLGKPFVPSALLDAIRRVLGKSG